MKRVIVDIETYKNEENLFLMPEPKPPANLKDPSKIAEAVKAAKEEQQSKAALDMDTAVIVSIGMMDAATGKQKILVNSDLLTGDEDERVMYLNEGQMLKEFWRMAHEYGGRIIGYNVLGFDLPIILRRSFALGVKASIMLNLAKYRVEPVTDLMQILYNWGASKYRGLKLVSKLYLGEDDSDNVDGADVAAMVESGDAEALIAYQSRDLVLTRRLFEAMNGTYYYLLE